MSNDKSKEFNREKEELESISIKIIDWSNNDLLKNASVELAATSEDFEWALPNAELETVEEKNKPTVFYKRRWRSENNEFPLWLRILFSTLLALSIGLLLGRGVIFFITLSIGEEEAITPITQEVVFPIMDNHEYSTYQLPELVTYVAQVGVFSTMEAASIEKDRIQKQGILSTVVKLDNKFVLFLTIANSLESVKGLAVSLVEEKDIDVYSKEIVLPAKELQVTEMEYKQVNDLYETFFYQLSIVTLLANGIPLNEDLKKEWQVLLVNFDLEQLPTDFVPLYDILYNGYEQLTANATVQEIINQQQKLLQYLSIYQEIKIIE